MTKSVLGRQPLVAFAATTAPARALKFYRDALGLRLVEQNPFAYVFDAGGTMLRVIPVEKVSVAPYTILGWQVPDMASTMTRLKKNGVKFTRYPGMGQDRRGIWVSPSGAWVAWFKDPDGNTLSLTQV